MESPSRMKRGLFFLILTQRLAPLGLSYYNHLYYFPTNPELAMTLIASLALPFQIEMALLKSIGYFLFY